MIEVRARCWKSRHVSRVNGATTGWVGAFAEAMGSPKDL